MLLSKTILFLFLLCSPALTLAARRSRKDQPQPLQLDDNAATSSSIEEMRAASPSSLQLRNENENASFYKSDDQSSSSSALASDNDDSLESSPSIKDKLQSSLREHTSEKTKQVVAALPQHSKQDESNQVSSNAGIINNNNNSDECEPEMIGFEIITGWVS